MEQWYQWAKDGGAVLAPFLLAALVWMDAERRRVIAASKDREDELAEQLAKKDEKLASLAERISVTLAEIKTILFTGRSV